MYLNTKETNNAWGDQTKPLRFIHTTDFHLVQEIPELQMHKSCESTGDVSRNALTLIIFLTTVRGRTLGKLDGHSSVLTGAIYKGIQQILHLINALK